MEIRSEVDESGFPTDRLLSLDMYRGLVLALLLLEAANYGWQHAIAAAHPDSWLAKFVEFQASHVPWVGCSLWDLIQPSFMFMVGVSMAYSYSKRLREGESYGRMCGHALFRAVFLILLGVFLRSDGEPSTNWTFEDVVTQIGLGYVFLFLLWGRGWKVHLLAAVAILLLHWMRFAMAPAPGLNFDWSIAAGDGWTEPLTGFAAHWNKNANPGHFFDVWFLNGFPRSGRFVANEGGYVTMNFIPALATMIFGLMTGDFIRQYQKSWAVARVLAAAGASLLLLGMALDFTGACPIVKRIWTPSFALFSGGWCLLILTSLYALVDLLDQKWLARPFAVLGVNSITVYIMIWLIPGWVNATLKTHIGENYGAYLFGEPYRMLMENLAVLLVIWGIAWWLFRRRIFVRI